MSEPLDQLLHRARLTLGASAPGPAAAPGPGFSDRILRRLRHQRQLAASPLFSLERAARWTTALAAAVTFVLWILPDKTDELVLETAARTWFEMPGEDSIWGEL